MTELGPQLVLVAGMAENRVIGTGHGGIPWRQPADAKRLRELCDGQAILIGRRTFEEMRGWFWNQRVFVLSRRKIAVPHGSFSAQSYESLPMAFDACAEQSISRLLVLGGGTVYEETLPLAQTMELTVIHAPAVGTVLFPAWREDEWEKVSTGFIPADSENQYAMTFFSLKRASKIIPSALCSDFWKSCEHTQIPP